MHILVVDDNPDLLRMLRIPLEAEGYRVSACSDAEAALAVLATEVPDLIVSDVMMPGTDGFGLLEHVRSDPRLVGIPVIFLTSAGDTVEERARALGVEHFVTKPFKWGQLLAMVYGTIERFSRLREAGVVRATAPPVLTAPDALASGIAPLDLLTGGLPRRHAYYLSGEVGMGKGAFGVQFLSHALARGEGAVMVTTDRPDVVLDLAVGVGLDLRPFVTDGRLAVLELAAGVDRLIETPEDYRLLAAELRRHAEEVRATRLVIASVLPLLCGNPRLGVTANNVSAFLRRLEEIGLTTVLIGEEPATDEERLTDVFLRRAAFGSFRMARDRESGRRDARVLSAERMPWASADGAARPYRIERGVGLVDEEAAPAGAPSPAEVRTRIRDTLARAGPGRPPALVVERTGELRVRGAWALTFRQCVTEALRAHERCALLVAQIDAETAAAPPAGFAEALRALWDPQHVACWLRDTELAVLALGADRSAMEVLAARIEERAGEVTSGAVGLRCGVAAFAAGALPSVGADNFRSVR
jgi:CheY-like chemotaxis protein